MASHDIAAVVDHLEKGDYTKFIEGLKTSIKLDGLESTLLALQEATGSASEKVGRSIFDCLICATLKTAPSARNPQVIMLFAQLGPIGAQKDKEDTSLAETAARQLFDSGDATHYKPAATLLRTWGVTPDCKNMNKTIRQAISEKLMAVARGRGAGGVAQAIGLLPGLLTAEQRKQVLHQADIVNCQEDAENAAKNFGLEEQHALVTNRLGRANHRGAARAVHLYGLEDSYPDCDYVWRADALSSAIAKGNTKAIMGLAIAEPRLRQRAVESLVSYNMPILATESANQWHLSLPAETEGMEKKMQMKLKKDYLSLPEDFVVHFVSSDSHESNLCDGINAMLKAPAVGFYIETSPLEHALASVLSISTLDEGFMFNLETMATNESFITMLQKLMKAKHIAKCGFGVKQTMEKLSAYPLLAAALSEPNFLVDIAEKVVERGLRTVKTETHRHSPRSKVVIPVQEDAKPISELAEKYLGKPLATSMSISDWNRSPLSERQQRYAALNALIPVQCYMLCLAFCGAAVD